MKPLRLSKLELLGQITQAELAWPLKVSHRDRKGSD